MTAALQSNTAIYSIHIFNGASYSADSSGESSGAVVLSPEDKRHQREILYGKGVLLYLAQQTGGEFFEVAKEQNLTVDLCAHRTAVAESVQSRILSLLPEQATQGFHAVVLAVTFPGLRCKPERVTSSVSRQLQQMKVHLDGHFDIHGFTGLCPRLETPLLHGIHRRAVFFAVQTA